MPKLPLISTRTRILALAGSLAVAVNSAADPLSDSHVFRLGVWEQDIDVTASATRQDFPEVELDFDEALGLDDSSTSIFLSYQWAFAEKWRLTAFYTNLEADGGTTARKDFNWDGKEYTAGLSIDTEFGLDTFLLAADYSFIRSEKLDLGVGLGLHAFDIATSLEVTAGIEDQEGQDSIGSTSSKNKSELLAPLPNVRGFARYLITPKWSIHGSVGWLSANYEDWDGDYLFLSVMTEYRFTERFGVGLSYQVSEIDVSNDNGRRKRAYDIDQHGPGIYLTYGL